MSSTIKQVAKLAGVSSATVSKYLNGVKLKPNNQAAVERSIKELNFTVNEMARNLRIQKSMTVGILIPELNNIFSTEIISHIENTLMQHNYGTIICDYKTNRVLEKQKLLFLLNKKVDALVIMPLSLTKEDLLDIDIPIVFVDRHVKYTYSNYVLVDNLASVKTATNHLISMGHTNIAVLCGNEQIATAKLRLDGYKEALYEHNIPINNDFVLSGEYTVCSGYSQTFNLLKNNNSSCTAIIATNYELTMGSLMAISELNLSIPNDISIIGYDTLDLSKVLNPKLTVVLQPLEDIGINVARILLDHLKTKSTQSHQVVLDTELIVKDSIKKLN